MRSHFAFAPLFMIGLVVPSCDALSQDLLSYVISTAPK